MTEIESSNSENSSSEEDSDVELQKAFATGRLKPGLNVEQEAPKEFINNLVGLKNKLEDLKTKLSWVERLDVTNDPAPAPPGTEIEGEDDIHNDFKRELIFYRQAQATALTGIQRLHKLGIPTKRPEDYYAQMAKTDDHMKLVREKLQQKQVSMERSEKAKKLRELRKYGKKVQQEVLQKRQKEKKEMLDAVKKYRKGQKNKVDFLEDMEPRQKNQQKTKNEHRPNKKREFKNKKFGFGGQKKRSKMNTASSSGDMSEFDPNVHQRRPGKKIVNKGNKNKQKRPGKSKRQKAKNRKR